MEKIVGKRYSKNRECFKYEVKWKGWRKTTWEPEANLEVCWMYGCMGWSRA